MTLNPYGGDVGIGTDAQNGAKLRVNGGVHVGGDSDPGDNNLYVDGDTSSLTFTDRTPYPKNTAEAYEAVKSLKKKADKDELDHDALHESVKTTKVFVVSVDPLDPEDETKWVTETVTGRNLSATVSAQNEVIKDLIDRIEKLEKK
jgi:predicted TIM-barrel fold metal-dependent hydrolase